MPLTLRFSVSTILLLASATSAMAQHYGAIAGRVLDRDTRIGLENVVVTCRPGGATVTNAHGVFSFVELRPGRYEIACDRADGYARTTEDLRQRVEIFAKGVQVSIDFLLQRSAFILGTLVDGAGNPVANAELRGRWPGPDIVTLTDTNGRFVLNGFAPWSNVTISADTDALIADDVRHEVPDGGLDGVIVRAFRAASIEGHVVDENGEALDGVSVEWIRHTTRSNHSFPPVQTDKEGRFAIKHLLPAKYTFSIQPEEGRADVVLRHTFEEGEAKQNVRLVYAPDSGPTISGRIIDTEGKPLAGVAFAAMGVDEQTRVTTDAQGNFVVRDLPEGGYQLTYFDYRGQVYYEVTRARMGDSGIEIKLKLEPARPKNRSSGPIAGRVFDAETNRPITRFTYKLIHGVYKEIDPTWKDQHGGQRTGFFGSGSWNSVNHPQGYFEFPTYATGDHSLGVRAEGYGTYTSIVAAPASDVVIGLTPELRVEGVVQDPTGRPLVGAKIVLGESNWYPPVGPHQDHEARTDADGRFAVGGLTAGETTLTAWHDDWGSTTNTVHLTEPVTNLHFTMPETGTLAGFVLLDGEPIRDIGIWVYRVDGDVLQYAGSGAACMNDENRYELKRLMPGRTRVHIRLDPRELGNIPELAATKFADIEPGTTTKVVFTLKSPKK